MSFTVAQVDAQTKRFEQAYRKGEITQGQYQHAMRVQSANRAAALKREQASQTPTAAELPRSDYWTATPSPAKPSVMPASGADLTRAGGTQITPPAGYTVTKVESVMVPAKEELEPSSYWTATPTPEKTAVMGPTVAKAPMVEAVSYEVTKKPEPVKQSDLGIGAQLLVAADVFGKVVASQTKEDTLINKLIRAETEMAIKPVLSFEAGAVNALETEAYGTASLAKSAVSSVQQQKLVYTPVKTPQLGPTVVGSGISLITGSGEAQRMNEMPFGYSMGSAFGEAGAALLTGMATGAVAGKTSTVIKTVVNPRINKAAESALARSTRLFESAANRIDPGLGKASELSRRAAAIGTKLDLVEAKAGAALTGKLVSPVKYGVKYGVVEPVKAKAVLVGEKVAASPVVTKASSVARRVVPDLKAYSKMVTGKYADDLVPQSFKDVRLASEPFREAPANLVKGIKETGVYQKASYVKSVQAPNTEMAKLLRAVPKESLDDLTLKAALKAEQKLVSPAVTKTVSKVSVTKPYISKELGQIGSLTTVKTKTSTPITKMVSDIKKSASNARASIGKAVGTRQTVITQVKPLSVKSTKNISTFEALQMSKQVAKQGKRLTQLVPYTPKEVSAIPALAKPATEVKQAATQIQKATTKQTKETTLPTLTPYPGTQRQRIREEYELVPVSYPKEVSGFTDKGSGLVPIMTPDLTLSISEEGKSEFVPVIDPFVIPDVAPKHDPEIIPKSEFVPVIVPFVIPDVAPKHDPEIIPIHVTDQWQPIPTPQDTPGPTIPKIPQFPSFSLGGGSGGRGGGDALTGRWFKYKNPIKTPKQMLKDFSSFGGGKRKGKRSSSGIGLNDKALRNSFRIGGGTVKIGGTKSVGGFGFSVGKMPKVAVVKMPKTVPKFGRMDLSLVPVRTNIKKVKQPRINYNLSKQRRKRKR